MEVSTMDNETKSGHAAPSGSKAFALTVAAIGVVYGDIGTSPLYALKECFSPHYGLTPGRTEVLGILSLIFWALTLIICGKYLTVILRFDSEGEGGVMALMQLVLNKASARARVGLIAALGLFGAAMLYGDGIITPAISVLSAVEGLRVAAPGLDRFVLPLTLLILLGIFSIQKYGTGGVGRVFGPFMLLWFVVLAAVGLVNALQTPDVFNAINPLHAVEFFQAHGVASMVVLGSVFLVVTGGESLYTDMGHFGRSPIMRGWFYVAYPALVLQYFGQGALLLREGHIRSTLESPFFHMVPSWGVIPLVILSTLAAIIASQAVISGAYSLTWQALQLGFLPRLKVTHTSHEERGQIYMPTVNWMLFISCVLLVLSFKTSGALASAYGIAVVSTMVTTTVLGWLAMRWVLGWNTAVASIITAIFLVMDLSFAYANWLKFFDGGYVPFTMAVLTFVMMITWHRGRQILQDRIKQRSKPLDDVIREDIDRYTIVPGTAIYMTGTGGVAPPAMMNNLKYNRVHHENVILLTVDVQKVARVDPKKRIEAKEIRTGVWKVILHYGFMDQLTLQDDIKSFPMEDILVDFTDVIFVLGHETLTVQDGEGMARWRKEIFVFLHRNSRTPARYFGIPVKQTLEVGSHLSI
ncbi:MAG: potassium transporter Kup [Candidatus Kapabacteria bacterium]|nr:potassium transporter Kup [Candidatus Kapabacteria bacterium]